MESLVHYSNPSHALSLLGALNEQRLRVQMCDVVLLVGDQRYQAHKSVLAACSDYFQSLFTPTDSSSLEVVNLDFCEPDAFEIVLNYIYSSSLFVDKGSLAAIQELGYSLGIPFLTNIVSTRPHASYCVSRKRLSFSEGDKNDAQARSVIVYRVQNDAPHPACSSYPREMSAMSSSSPVSDRAMARPPSERAASYESGGSSQAFGRKASERSRAAAVASCYPYTSILKGNPSNIASVRPQLTSSVSFSEAEVQHIGPDAKEERQEPGHPTKVGPLQGQAGEQSQTIDRSGPLIKSLLRRSLSMDSPVPVFSPALELTRDQSAVGVASRGTGTESSAHNGNPKRASPLLHRPKHPSRSDGETQVEREFSVKAEPSSPLADPADIVRITVGDALPVTLKDLQTIYHRESGPDLNSFGKRKDRPDNRRYPFKKSRMVQERPPSPDESVPQAVPQTADGEEWPLNKLFKCWNCLKVFRSGAGLHRHVNMYHNPEKPYACDICHKRFHTNFKVWTHSQTQHGVVQNPASSSSASVLDDRFQKKLIDMVREREIKKALLWKLKRNTQGLHTPAPGKKRPRPRAVCPYCGKAFAFQAHYRQHLRTHDAEKAEGVLYREQKEIVHPKDSGPGVYSCRLCSVKLSSLFEQGDHERGCRHATVCPYCGLRFSSPSVKTDHETHCKYKKLTCLECMRTFKSSFSIWRHQVEVHNQNMMTAKDQIQLAQQEDGDEPPEALAEERFADERFADEPLAAGSSRESASYSDSSGPPVYDSEDSSPGVPQDLSVAHLGELVVKEEPVEESLSEMENAEADGTPPEEPGVWPCEKCGNLFGLRKDLERHQELLCHIKPFICHICNKAFRTNFRLWSHFQSHMQMAHEAGAQEMERQPSPPPPSPPAVPTLQDSRRPSPQASVLVAPQTAATPEEPGSPEACSSSFGGTQRPESEGRPGSRSPLSRSNSVENPGGPQESETLFYHAPSLSALVFKRQYMCKLCHRTFKTAFSLWSHEQSHGHL
ncbi:zinc finger and BTB domain-containing protein 21 [Brachionichthys hirsutus]|uniref:zinc finger and BTB domain-containing protein 21 n=1 Tax=Brachionichthys hirsutus TaxID=412623 RepID=UPI0036043417